MGCTNCAVAPGEKVPGCSSGGCQTGGCNRLNVYDWFAEVPISFNEASFNVVEISFKHGARKGYYRNRERLELFRGDMVVVEAAQGFDIGEVSLTGELVKLQMKKKRVKDSSDNIRNILRQATEQDVLMLSDARAKEIESMIKARAIARSLNVDMKIGDVEFQGDLKKVTFYYTAEGRIDFRELVRRLAREFKMKIEMRQIGSRQEAGRIGGIGSCGRELCCSTWLTDFKSVSTAAARYQNLAINTDKLSGQCGRLKCCLNYELDTYMDAIAKFPKGNDKIKTKLGVYYLKKTEIFQEILWYEPGFGDSKEWVKIKLENLKKIQNDIKAGKTPESLTGFIAIEVEEEKEEDFEQDLVGAVSLRSLERKARKKRRSKKQQGGQKGQGRRAQGKKSGEGPKAEAGGKKQEGGGDGKKKSGSGGGGNRGRGRGGRNRNRKRPPKE